MFLLLLTAAAFVSAQDLKVAPAYSITGMVKDKDSGWIYLLSEDGRIALDSSAIVKGHFFMSGELPAAGYRLFRIEPGSWSFQAVVESRGIELTIDTALGNCYYGHGAKGSSWVLIRHIRENGSPVADVWERFNKETDVYRFQKQVGVLYAQLGASGVTDSAKVQIQKSIDSVVDMAVGMQKVWVEKYIHQNPSSEAGPFVFSQFLTSYRNLSPSYLRSVVAGFTGKATSTVWYGSLTEKLHQLTALQPGKMAPDFTLLTPDNSPVTLSAIKSRYLLIDFWASWCAPCRKAIPHWKEVYSTFHGKGLEIISVSNDSDRVSWMNALRKEQMPWIQVLDYIAEGKATHPVAALYDPQTLPHYLLLDGSRNIILVSKDDDVVTGKIKELMK